MDRQVLMSFAVSGRRLALPLDAVRGVVPVPLLQPPVAAPRFVEGFFDYQGTPVAAIRLDRLLDLGEQTLGIYSPLLVLADDLSIALHVDKVDAILTIPGSHIQAIAASETINACVVGRLTDRDETVYVLSKQDLLLAAEREKLAAHHVMQQRRMEALNADAVHAS